MSSAYPQVIRQATRNKTFRDFPGRQDPRFREAAIFPHVTPKFSVDFGNTTSVFTIGSCFARNIEEALEPLGVHLPTRGFSVPPGEWNARPNGLLNEFNPGTISQRIMAALGSQRSPEQTIVPSGQNFADLLLLGGADVSHDRALQRREEIFRVYQQLAVCDVVVITLGFVEAWFDRATGWFLNRVLPHAFAMANPERFEFRRLDVFDAFPPLERALKALSEAGKKVILTVSPVPIQTTFTSDDCVTANEFSKSVLRVCAERLSRSVPNVDYFPSFEIVRSAGLPGYINDNVHVRDDLVRRITEYMIAVYRGDARPSTNAADLAR